MRRTIETAPRDGKVVILEDDANGIYDVAHWSPEAAEWIGENGKPSKIKPSHWYPMPGDNYLQQGLDVSSSPSQVGPSLPRRYRFFPFSLRRATPKRPMAGDVIAPRSDESAAPVSVAAVEAQTAPVEAKRTPHARWATSSVAATLVAAALIGMYFRAEVAAYVTRYAGQQDIFKVSTIGGQVVEQETQLPSQDSRKSDLLELQHQAESDQQAAEAPALDPRPSSEKEQRTEVLANELAAELRQSLQRERDRAEALATELASARRDIETQVALSSKKGDEAAQLKQAAESATAELRQSLQREHDRAEAMASELASVRRDVETQAALSSKKGDEAAQLKQAAESATTELPQSLQQERDKAEAQASKLARARQDVETQTALSRKTGDEAAQLKQAAESTMAELQRERGRAEALARDLESARRTIDGRVALESAPNNQIVQVKQAAEVAAREQPAAAEEQGSPKATRLIAHASALLGQGNIGAARTVLQRAAETGSAQASFMLAETYDPAKLSAWGTYGTRGEATKAREFYAKAHAGGIQEAKDRLNALRQ